jgi:hypothetical protein
VHPASIGGIEAMSKRVLSICGLRTSDHDSFIRRRATCGTPGPDPANPSANITLPMSQNISVHFDDDTLGRVLFVEGEANDPRLTEWEVTAPLLGTSILHRCRELAGVDEATQMRVTVPDEEGARLVLARRELHELARQHNVQRLPRREAQAERARLFVDHPNLMEGIAQWAARRSTRDDTHR